MTLLTVSTAVTTRAANDGDSSFALLIIAIVLLTIGVAALTWLVRWSRQTDAGNQAQDHQDALLQMLLASEGPALRDYLQQSANPEASEAEEQDSASVLERLATFSLPKPAEKPVPLSVNDLALALALLESRLKDLTATAVRIERQSVTKDRMVWTVLSVIGGIVAILGGIATFAVSMVRLLGAG